MKKSAHLLPLLCLLGIFSPCLLSAALAAIIDPSSAWSWLLGALGMAFTLLFVM